jgi:hypothetical protein
MVFKAVRRHLRGVKKNTTTACTIRWFEATGLESGHCSRLLESRGQLYVLQIHWHGHLRNSSPGMAAAATAKGSVGCALTLIANASKPATLDSVVRRECSKLI